MKTVFIGGASSDIGIPLCAKYAQAGYKVIAHYRKMRAEFQKVCDLSPSITPYQLDFSDPGKLEEEIENKNDLFGAVDVLVNLAADMRPVSFLEASSEDILGALKSNLLPGLLLMKAIGPSMIKRGWGRVVQTSSIGVKYGGGMRNFPYALSKHAEEFIPAECRKWAQHNVLVNVVRIGVTDTRIHKVEPDKSLEDRSRLIPMKRPAAPLEICEFLFWLGSEENSFVTGEVIAASGGE